jgi:hypothetical protein
MTIEKFCSLPQDFKKDIFDAHAKQLAVLRHHGIKTFVETTTLYKLFHFFIETHEVGYFDNDGIYSTDDKSFHSEAFSLEDKNMEHWLHFTSFNMEIMKSISGK